MAGERANPAFFEGLEALGSEPIGIHLRDSRTKSAAASSAFHVLVIALMLVAPMGALVIDDELVPGKVMVRFWELGGEGPGGGGGGGGSGGRRPTAYVRARLTLPQQRQDPEVVKPRRAPIAPRKPRALSFNDIDVPDVPQDMMAFEGAFSPDAADYPGLSLTDPVDYGGFDTEPSSGSGGGIGGGVGTGVGTGEGWGVGPGSGGGFGGGDYSPGGWDIEPVVIFKPPEPDYPPLARENMVSGEVIVRVLVKVDGSTEVLGVIKSLPHCVEAAKQNAKLWRWKPALKNGKPVEAIGIITVTFDIFAQGSTRS
jgi:protein TonB